MKQTIKMIQIISVTLMTILAVQASAATEITTLRENQLQFSAGILIRQAMRIAW